MGHATVSFTQTRDILTRTSGFLSAYDFSLNPYSGCSFGCTYCYAAFFSRSKKLRNNWGHWVTVKENAVRTLARRKQGSLNGKKIYISSVTDPYQPIERKLKLTRKLLSILCTNHTPILVIQTRSPDVVRDIDVFSMLVDRGGQVSVNMTVTTDNKSIRRIFEPFCPSNKKRLEAISRIVDGGINAGITLTPLLVVSDIDSLSRQLLQTGAQRFVCQDFQFSSGHFVASTRSEAQQQMANALGCSIDDFRNAYRSHYVFVRDRLREKLSPVGEFSEGKRGFAPP